MEQKDKEEKRRRPAEECGEPGEKERLGRSATDWRPFI